MVIFEVGNVKIGRFGMVVALGSEFSQPRNFGDSKIIKDGR